MSPSLVRLETCDLTVWNDLYSLLRPVVRHWVRSSNISTWRGQEDDIVEDIVQETITRILRYSQRVGHGECIPINSLRHFSITIARHYYFDLVRRERRLIRFAQLELFSDVRLVRLAFYNQVDPSEEAFAHLSLMSLIAMFAQIIVKFPDKQRIALLIDLANHSDFDEQPTLLEQAMYDVGVCLRDYQRPLPEDPLLRSRHASLLSLAYRRLRETALAQLRELNCVA